MNTTETALTELVKAALKSETYLPAAEMTARQLADIYKESLAQAVPLSVYEALPESARAAVPQFETTAFGVAANNIRVTYEHIEIGKALEAEGIPYCILKGCASAYYYPNPEQRSMGDTDFLVAKRDTERAAKAISKIGYKLCSNAEPHEFHYEYQKGSAIAEMHYSISGQTESGMDPAALTDDILASARKCSVQYGEIMLPSPYYHAIIMLLHVYRHYVQGGIGLRHLCDWAVFAASNDYDAAADRLLKFTDEWHLTRFCQMLSEVSAEYLGIEPKASFGVPDKRLCAQFMDEILGYGNFGRKKEGTLEHLFSTKTLDNGGKNSAETFFSSVKGRVCHYWPKAEKNVLVLAVGTVVFTARYLWRALTQKRKIHIISDYKNAKKQTELHQKLTDSSPKKR